MAFVGEDAESRNKVLKKYVTVKVVIDMVCGDISK